jgi:hypothetical protein
MAPGYLRAAVDRLEANPLCGFVAARLRTLRDEPLEADRKSGGTEWAEFKTAADFVRSVFRGVEPMFGSVMYRRAAVDGVTPDHDRYSTLVDRPFLLTILERWTAALVADPPMAWYREHGEGDRRNSAMTGDHILHLLETYRAVFPATMTTEDRSLLLGYTGYWLPALLAMVPAEAQPPRHRVLFRAWRNGLYDPRRSRIYGRKRLIASMLSRA